MISRKIWLEEKLIIFHTVQYNFSLWNSAFCRRWHLWRWQQFWGVCMGWWGLLLRYTTAFLWSVLLLFRRLLIYWTQCVNQWNLLSNFFWQKVRERNVFNDEVTIELISRNFLVRVNFSLFNTVVSTKLLSFISWGNKKLEFSTTSV